MTRQTITITVPRALWLTANGREHRMQAASRTRTLRTIAKLAARKLTPVPAVEHVLIEVGYPTARRADPPNAYPTVKALIDGIVDAGILPDDDHHHIPETRFRRGTKSTKGHYQITITLHRKDGGDGLV